MKLIVYKSAKWYKSKASEIYSAVISLMGTDEQAIIDIFFELSSEKEYQKLKKEFDVLIMKTPSIKADYENLDDLLKKEFGIKEIFTFDLILNRFNSQKKCASFPKRMKK